MTEFLVLLLEIAFVVLFAFRTHVGNLCLAGDSYFLDLCLVFFSEFLDFTFIFAHSFLFVPFKFGVVLLRSGGQN